MTDQEDRENELINARMRECQHDIYWTQPLGARCCLCGAKFIMLLLPEKRKVFPVDPNDDE